MNARRTSGLTPQDLHETRVYMRTFNDAIDCLDDIAHREAARVHYKSYIKQLAQGLRWNHLVLDNEGSILASADASTANVFRVMTFTRDIV